MTCLPRALAHPQGSLPRAVRLSARCRPFSASPLHESVPGTPKTKLIGRHRVFPTDLFRVNTSDKVILHDYEAQKKLGRPNYDLKLHRDKKVHPMTSENFEGPNGASVFPNGEMLQEVVRNFWGRVTTIHFIPKGTELPDELILLHEHSDHFSIQCTRPMPLRELNRTITAFLREKAQGMDKAEFDRRFPFQL